MHDVKKNYRNLSRNSIQLVSINFFESVGSLKKRNKKTIITLCISFLYDTFVHIYNKTYFHIEKFHTIILKVLFIPFYGLQTDIKYCTGKELFKMKCILSSSFLHMFLRY